MIQIRPVSNLRIQFIDIEKRLEKETRYFTKNGYGTMVVLSLEASSRLTDGVESVLAEADRYFSDFSWYVELKFKISGSPIEPSQVFFFEMIASSVIWGGVMTVISVFTTAFVLLPLVLFSIGKIQKFMGVKEENNAMYKFAYLNEKMQNNMGINEEGNGIYRLAYLYGEFWKDKGKK